MGVNFSIGDLKRVATLVQNQPIDNDTGGQLDNWVDVLITRCSLEKKRGYKDVEQGSLQFNKTYSMVCRWQSAIVINQDTRWRIEGEDYQIMDFEAVDQKKHLFVFTLNKIDV